MPPVFIFVTDLTECDPDWPAAMAQAEALREPLASKLGFVPHIRLASLPCGQHARGKSTQAGFIDFLEVLTTEVKANQGDIFVIPSMLDFGLIQKAQLAEWIASVRHQFYQPSIVYDDVEPCHPLLVQAFAERIYQCVASVGVAPPQVGLLLVASGEGDSGGRAQSYRLMRLLWDDLGCARGEVGFQ